MSLPAPNYTQAPNLLFDKIFKTLKEGELRVVLVLIRQTFGWHKKHDEISISQIAKKSGLEKSSVCKSLISLIQKGLVTKNKFGRPGFERCHYSLVIENSVDEVIDDDDDDDDICDEEKELISKSLYQCSKNTPPQCSKNTPPSVLKTHTKETLKETIQKKQQQQPAVAPASAAASFKNSKEKIYPCLLELERLTDQERLQITKKQPEHKIIEAVKLAKSKKTAPKNLAAFIMWAAENSIQCPPDAKDVRNENENYAKKIKEKIISPKGVELEILSKGVEFVFTTCQKTPICLDYSDYSFKEILKSKIKEYGFMVKA